ncbi:hypothetical protein ACJX0J_029931, partial [Zea mays]
ISRLLSPQQFIYVIKFMALHKYTILRSYLFYTKTEYNDIFYAQSNDAYSIWLNHKRHEDPIIILFDTIAELTVHQAGQQASRPSKQLALLVNARQTYLMDDWSGLEDHHSCLAYMNMQERCWVHILFLYAFDGNSIMEDKGLAAYAMHDKNNN